MTEFTVPLAEKQLRFELSSDFERRTIPPNPRGMTSLQAGTVKVTESVPPQGETLSEYLNNTRGKKSAHLETSRAVALSDGTPAIRARISSSNGIYEGLYFIAQDKLVSIELFFSIKRETNQMGLMDVLVSSVVIEEATPVKTEPPLTKGRKMSFSSAPRALRTLLLLVCGLFTMVPAYLGAGRGYDQQERGKSKGGAAVGALKGVFLGTGLGAVIALIFLGFYLWSTDNVISGIADRSGVFIIFFMLIVVAALTVGVCGGIFAAFGAAFGASKSRQRAQVWAALGSLIGVLLAPTILALMPISKDRSSYEGGYSLQRPASQ